MIKITTNAELCKRESLLPRTKDWGHLSGFQWYRTLERLKRMGLGIYENEPS